MAARALDLLAKFCTVLGALAIFVMMMATCWDVVARSVANAPLHGIVELVEVMMLVTAMLGLPQTFLRDEQIKIDLIDSFVSDSFVRVLRVIALMLAVVLLAILAFNVYQPMLDAQRFGDVKYDLGVPLFPLYGLIIFSFCVSILSCVLSLVRMFPARSS